MQSSDTKPRPPADSEHLEVRPSPFHRVKPSHPRPWVCPAPSGPEVDHSALWAPQDLRRCRDLPRPSPHTGAGAPPPAFPEWLGLRRKVSGPAGNTEVHRARVTPSRSTCSREDAETSASEGLERKEEAFVLFV